MKLNREEFAAFFATNTGQKVLNELEERFIKPPSYSRDDTHHTAYLEGKKAAIRWLLNFADPNNISE